MRRTLIAAFVAALTLGAAGGGTTPAAAGPGHGVEKWALIVGVDKFQGRTQPNVGSVGDARALRQVLLNNGWPDDHILVLTDGAATQAGIRNGFRWLADRSNDNTFSVFHYSGHVKQSKRTEYLWPHDNRFIPDTELANAMRSVRGWLWVDIAGCEAGGFNEGISAPNRLFTASSRANEKSYEYPDWKQTVMGGLQITQALLQNRGDRNSDGRTSIHEAFMYAYDRAPAMTKGQRYGPQHPEAAGGDSEWFLFTPPPPPPPPPPREEKPSPKQTCWMGVCVPVSV